MKDVQSTVEERFVDGFRGQILSHLTDTGVSRHARTSVDDRFLKALDHFLEAEKSSGLDPALFDQGVPDDFPIFIASLMNVRSMNQEENSYNTGADALDRISSPERNQHHADLLFAMDRYLIDSGMPYQIRNGDVVLNEVKEEDTKPRLWKRVVEKAEDGKFVSRLEEADAIDFSKKPVLCFGNARTLNNDPREIAGMMKQVETTIGGPGIYEQKGKNEGIEIYCISYPLQNYVRTSADVCAGNAAPDTYISPDAQNTFDRFLKPSLETNLPELPDVGVLNSVLRKWNLFSYSFGTSIVKQLRNATVDCLHEKGYTTAQIKQALAEAYSMNVNPVVNLKDPHPCGSFSSVYVVSQNDLISKSRGYYQQYIGDQTAPAVIPVSDNELLVWTDGPVAGNLWSAFGDEKNYDASGFFKQGAAAVPTPAADGRQDQAGHTLKLPMGRFSSLNEQGEAVMHDPSWIEYSLRNAVARDGPVGDLRDMFDPVHLVDLLFMSKCNAKRTGTYVEQVDDARSDQTNRENGR